MMFCNKTMELQIHALTHAHINTQLVETRKSCKMSGSWGGVCNMLTVVNPILLLHAGNLSGEYVINVVTTHTTWEFGGDGCVGS